MLYVREKLFITRTNQDTYHISIQTMRDDVKKPEIKSTAHTKLLSPVIFNANQIGS